MFLCDKWTHLVFLFFNAELYFPDSGLSYRHVNGVDSEICDDQFYGKFPVPFITHAGQLFVGEHAKLIWWQDDAIRTGIILSNDRRVIDQARFSDASVGNVGRRLELEESWHIVERSE